jgi:PAS domain S-box-containing protein
MRHPQWRRFRMNLHDLPSPGEASQRIARLEAEHARMEFALEAARACTWECDMASGQVVLSASWAAMLDEPPRPMRTTLAELATRVPGDDYERVLRPAMTRMLKSPSGDYTVEHRFLNVADETLWLWTHGRITQRDPASGRALVVAGITRDITPVRRAAAGRALSEARLEMLVALSSDWYWEQDAQLRYVHWSDAPGSRWPKDFFGKTRWELPVVGACSEHWARHRASLERREPFRDFEYQILSPGGKLSWVSVSGDPLFDEHGHFTGYCGVGRDITARKAAEQQLAQLNRELKQHAADRELALAETEARYRAVVAEAPVGIALVTRELRILEANPYLCRILGYSQGELVGMRLGELALPDEPPQAGSQLPGAAIERRYLRRDGSVVWAKVSVASITLQPGGVDGQVTVIEDITERRLAQEKLSAYAAQVSALSVKVLVAQEHERQHIARELHDEIGQILTAVRMALVPRTPPEAGADALVQASEVVDSAIGRMRRLSFNLRPPLLDDLGLCSALRELGRQHRERSGMAVDVDLPEVEPALHRDLEIAVYRVCQEALTNVARHSHAACIAIRLDTEGDRVLLMVHDDGVGFALDEVAATDRLGIVGMRERARLHGGRFSVDSIPGRGTTVRAWFPMQATG